jgi:hypothetical protein
LAEDGDTTIGGATSGEFLPNGDLTIHIRVNDPDFDISATGEDVIAEDTADNPVGPVKISVKRASATVVLGFAGGSSGAVLGVIDVGDNAKTSTTTGGGSLPIGVYGTSTADPATSNEVAIRQFGPMVEIAPDAGIFEIDIVVRYTDGPASSTCPVTSDFAPTTGSSASPTSNPAEDRFDINDATNPDKFCILQGDILQVQYTDQLMHQVTKTLSPTLLHLT